MPRIIYFDIDTLRPDHMGCYGYQRNTTPNIDQIAADGMRFDNYYCSDAPCLPSRAALSTGMFGIHNGAVGHTGTNADRRILDTERNFSDRWDNQNLHNIFRRAGMFTASISTFPERHSSWWFNAGFNETYNVGKRGHEVGNEVLDVASDWLDRHGNDENWYLHVHLWDPHTPYRAPEDFGNPFENEPLYSFVDENVLKEHLNHTGPHCINEINMYDDQEFPQYPRHPGKASDMEGLRKIIDGYDCGVAYADQLIGIMIDQLKKMGIYEDTAIIVSADHGENMGEFGIYGEHATADHPTCHIPMIVKWPGGAVGSDDKLHYNIDWVPTVADLLNVQSYPEWDGQSFVNTVLSGEENGRDYLVISQLAHVCQRSVVKDGWLYIRTYHDGFHLFPREMLFNLKNDPYQQYDVSAENKELTDELGKILLDWQDDQMMKSRYNSDPLWEVMREGGPSHTRGYFNMYLKRLRETGREQGADELERRHSTPLANAEIKFSK